VLDGQHEHHAGLFPNVADNPVITNTIAPQRAKLMPQGFSKAVRVFGRGNAGVHIVENFPLHRPIMAFRSLSTRGSYSTVQTKAFAQLIRSDAELRVRDAFLRCAKVVRVVLEVLHNKIPQVIGQGHTSRLRGSGELRLYFFRHVERYRHAFQTTGKLPRMQRVEAASGAKELQAVSRRVSLQSRD
jgi:hypothetical protein